MARKKLPALTHQQAIDQYFGGIKAMSKSKLPFKCKCGVGVYHVKDSFKHIREDHGERIKK